MQLIIRFENSGKLSYHKWEFHDRQTACHLLDSFADWHVHELTRVDDALTRITQGEIRCLPRLPRVDRSFFTIY